MNTFNKYYYIKLLGPKLNKDLISDVNNDAKGTDKIYDKVKIDVSNKSGDEDDDLVLIKAQPNKDKNDVMFYTFKYIF